MLEITLSIAVMLFTSKYLFDWINNESKSDFEKKIEKLTKENEEFESELKTTKERLALAEYSNKEEVEAEAPVIHYLKIFFTDGTTIGYSNKTSINDFDDVARWFSSQKREMFEFRYNMGKVVLKRSLIKFIQIESGEEKK